MIVPSTAWSMSASPKMIIGPLPPSSSITCLPAARRATDAPVAVEPTNPTPSTSGWPATSSPTSAPGPVTRLTAPGGKSPSAMHSLNALQVLGRHTEVLGRLADLAVRFRQQRLALVEGEDPGQILTTPLDLVRDPVQPARALESLEHGDRRARAVRGFHRLTRVRT